MANIICARLDRELAQHCATARCYYSRYADDITISTNLKRMPRSVCSGSENRVSISRSIKKIIRNNGFKINAKKTRLQLEFERRVVTGLLVNKRVNVERKYIRRIRAMLHAWRKHGYESAEQEYWEKYRVKQSVNPRPEFHSVLRGMISYVKMVRGAEDPIYNNFQRLFDHLDEIRRNGAASAVPLNLVSPKIKRIFGNIWILEDEYGHQGTGFLLKGWGLVTCNHCINPTTRAFRIEDESKKYLVKKGKFDENFDVALFELVGLELPETNAFEAGLRSADISDEVTLAGFPGYSPGGTGYLRKGRITGMRKPLGNNRSEVDIPILFGASGSPILDIKNRVVGMAVCGARTLEEASQIHDHQIIPIEDILYFLKGKSEQT